MPYQEQAKFATITDADFNKMVQSLFQGDSSLLDQAMMGKSLWDSQRRLDLWDKTLHSGSKLVDTSEGEKR